MDFSTMSAAELVERRTQIATEIDADGADLDALEEEVRAINTELENRKAAEERRNNIRQAVAAGAGEVVAEIKEEKEERKMFEINSVEYRDAWVKNLIHRELTAEERSALSSAGAVIPTMTVNEVWTRLKDAELLGKVDLTQFPNYVRFPKATTVNAAAAGAVGASITESSDVIGYVDLIPNEYVKLLTVGADIEHMGIPAIHDWIVNNLVESIRNKIDDDILTGSGTNALKGITASITSPSTLAANPDKAAFLGVMGALGSQYQAGAIWVMTPKMFFEKVMTASTLNDYVINDGFSYKLFGHDVVLKSNALVSSKENVFYGDPKAYKANIFKPIEVKPFESATTTNWQFRGACLADGELIDTSAWVRYAQT